MHIIILNTSLTELYLLTQKYDDEKSHFIFSYAVKCENIGKHPLISDNLYFTDGDSNVGKRGAGAEATSGQICNRQWWSLIISVFFAKAVADIIVYTS